MQTDVVPLTGRQDASGPKAQAIPKALNGVVCHEMGIAPNQLLPEMSELQSYHLFEKHLKRIRNKKTPINVFFHANKSSKWSYHSLFELMAHHPRFRPVVFPVPELLADCKTPDHAGQMDRLTRFFAERGLAFKPGYDAKTNMFFDLFSGRNDMPDVVFYTQVWDTIPEHQPNWVSRHALTCDSLYHAAIAKYGLTEIEHEYYKNMWRFFASTPQCKQRHLEMYPSLEPERVVLTGWPRLDPYYENSESKSVTAWDKFQTKRKRIIWAPHWTVWSDPNIIKFGTFSWSSGPLLQFARDFPDILWGIKPHPTLWKTMGNGRSESPFRDYFQQWLDLPNVLMYDDGDYFDFFKESDLMITDSVSFLVEYLFTGKAVIHLSDKTTAPLISPGPEIVKSYYQAFCEEELRNCFQNVVIRGNDTKAMQRLEAQAEYYTPIQPAGKRIFQYLKHEFGITD